MTLSRLLAELLLPVVSVLTLEFTELDVCVLVWEGAEDEGRGRGGGEEAISRSILVSLS